MPASTLRSLWTGALVVLVVAFGIHYLYLLDLVSQTENNMSAPLQQRLVPRLSSLAAQLPIAGSYLPALQKPLLSPTTTRASQITPSTTQPFSSSAKMTHDTTNFKEAVQSRRTIYQLTKKSTISDDKIKEMVTTAIKDVPSAFNSQTARLVVLLKEEHDKFWQIVEDILRAHVPAEKWSHTGERITMFKNAYGTILFYEDPEPIKALSSKLPRYADKFPQWSEHTSAMHQYMLWTALEAEGMGCNLQHYNPLPDEKAAHTWNIPEEWSLKAQLVFGTPAEGAREQLAEKHQEPIEKRLFIHGA